MVLVMAMHQMLAEPTVRELHVVTILLMMESSVMTEILSTMTVVLVAVEIAVMVLLTLARNVMMELPTITSTQTDVVPPAEFTIVVMELLITMKNAISDPLLSPTVQPIVLVLSVVMA